MRLYLAGKMSWEPQFAFPQFDAAAADLRSRGWEIISPAELDLPATRAAALASPDGAPNSDSIINGETWGDFLSRDVKVVADEVDGIIFLDERWVQSRGARLEAFVALQAKHQNFYLYRGPDQMIRKLTPLDVHEALMVVPTYEHEQEPLRQMGRLIGLCGVAEAGKDTVYGMIRDDAEGVGLYVERDAFADRLKESAAAALGIFEGGVEFCNALKESGEITWDLPNLAKTTITGRQYLQMYGTEAHREVFDTDFWIRAVLPDPNKEFLGRAPFDALVVTDVRFDNEAEAIKECGGEVWEIDRPGAGEAAKGHASEAGISPHLVDRVVDNSKGLDELRENVLLALEGN